jgi:CRP-like cAMP-binding protein
MEEQFYPQDDLVYNKGDVLDGILFVVEGEVHITMRSSSS